MAPQIARGAACPLRAEGTEAHERLVVGSEQESHRRYPPPERTYLAEEM